MSALAADTAAKLMPYNTQATSGSCHFLPLSGSKNTKYASIPGKSMTTCARCVKVSCKDPNCNAGASVIAYVVDVPTSQSQTTNIGLSPGAIQALTANAVNSALSVTYKFVTCPAEFIPGNVLACSMEGMGKSYIPIQFIDTNRVITAASFNGQGAGPSQSESSYLWSTSGGDNPNFLKNIQINLQAGTQNITGTVSFDSADNRSCVDLGAQFSVPAGDSDAADEPSSSSSKAGDSSSSSSSSKSLIIAIACGAVGLIAVIAIVVCIIRRRRAKDDDEGDYENNLGTDHAAVIKDHGPIKKDPTPPPPPMVSAPIVPPSTTNDFPPSTTASYARMDSDPPVKQPYVPAPAYQPTPARQPSPVYTQSSPAYAAQSSPVPQPKAAPVYVAPAPAFVPPPQPTFSPPVVPERQPSVNSRVATRASYKATTVTSPGPQSYSEMFSDANRGLYTRGSVRDDRKSFDIDEERDDDAPVTTAPVFDSGVLTSPESYVRATQLPRNSRPQAPTFAAPDRPSMHEMRSSTSGGYSRDSLNLLDYSRTKKQGSSAVQF
ncbi:hypothetical protein ACHHYP_13057 [Achlya hypogyna]|uniref:Expansin-like EG45 domain-containing protein n=1 Tax=Achlya hypogyna TaxID=1202772 RepID=A0A1V9YG48_ACHHY|nr:hypothetical protein ACHHYP_13057 [Achlya hypogyna]